MNINNIRFQSKAGVIFPFFSCFIFNYCLYPLPFFFNSLNSKQMKTSERTLKHWKQKKKQNNVRGMKRNKSNMKWNFYRAPIRQNETICMYFVTICLHLMRRVCKVAVLKANISNKWIIRAPLQTSTDCDVIQSATSKKKKWKPEIVYTFMHALIFIFRDNILPLLLEIK